MDDELTMNDIDIVQINTEWCAFHKDGRELARSHSKDLLLDYLDDVIPRPRSRTKQRL